MIIKSISLENFRSFKDKTLIDTSKKLNIFVGPNKAGKSNIIKSLQILNSISRNDWYDLHIYNVFDYDARKTIMIEIEFCLNSEDRQHLINILFPDHSPIDYNKNSIFKEIKYLISFGNNEIFKERVSVLNTKAEYKDLIIHESEGVQYVSNNLSKIKEISEFDTIQLEKRYGEWHTTKSMFNPKDKTIEYEIGDAIIQFFRKIRVNPSASIQSFINFQDMIKYKQDKDARNYAGFLDLVKNILDIPNIQINRDNPGRPIYNKEDESQFKYNNLKFEEKGLNSPLSFSSLSYGTQQILHILILIEEAKAGETLCIEEPENNLHSHVQRKLFKRIIEKAKDNDLQFFITTHSPIFTKLDQDSMTYLVSRDKGFSKVMPIENKSDLKLIKQQLGISNSDIYGDDSLLCLEGDSEEIALPIILQALGYEQLER